MYCKTCGEKYENESAIICVKCGAKRGVGTKYCHKCGKELMGTEVACLQCGESTCPDEMKRSKIVAGLLGIFLGQFGIHNFYLGKTNLGVIQLSVGLGSLILAPCTFGITAFAWFGIAIWGFVEGIMILTGHIDKDGDGNPLKD